MFFINYKSSYLQARPGKPSQGFNATYRNIARHNIFRAFGHLVTKCCDMLDVTNRTSVHGLAQRCCTNVAKWLQHHATSTKVAWKIGPFSNLILQHPTCRSTQTIATFRRNIQVGAIAIARPELQWVARSHLASTGRTKKLCLCLCSPHDRVVVPYWWVYSASCLQASINTLN